MSLQLVAILAAATMLGAFAISHMMRVRIKLETRVYSWRMWLMVIVALVAMPIGIAFFTPPAKPKGQSPIVEITILYIVTLIFFAILINVAATLVRQFVMGKSRPTLLLALIGREPSVADIPIDPPMTDAIQQSVELVDTRNAIFPQNRAFMDQTEQPRFQTA